MLFHVTYNSLCQLRTEAKKYMKVLKNLVSITIRATPVPIPNTMVKPYGADDTAREAVWKSRLSPVRQFLLFMVN